MSTDSLLESPLLEGIGLTLWRGERCLFADLDLGLRAGRALHIRGPNGSGKTSLLRVLCGLLPPSDGHLRVDGETAAPSSVRLRERVSFLGHADALKLELDVVENLQFARTVSGHAPLADPLPLLARVGLAHVFDLEARRLSAGQRRRLALARLMGSGQRVWLMDEPFTALDRDGIALLANLLDDGLTDGVAIAFTSHQAAPLANRIDTLDLA